MIRSLLLVLGTTSGLAVAASGSGQLAPSSHGACIPLTSSQGTSFERWSVRVYRPGNYCLSQDLKQTELPAWLRLPHMAVPHDPLMVSESGNVSIDLAGHSMVTTTAAGQGMMHLGGAAWTDGKEHPHMQAARNISLRNGSISTKFQPAVIMAHRWNGNNKRFDGKKVGGHYLLGARLTDSRGDIDRYESTDYVLENLTLTSDQIVVLMQGKNNIIRRCKIIGSNAAVNLYGPNLVFEDNEIVMTARDPADAGGEPQVALYVEDGFGAVIRNNRFVIKGRPDGAVAMEFSNSAGVVLEGNTVEGKASLYRTLDEKSTVEVRPATQQMPLATRHPDPRETQ
ncbi:right-handed parallel beta-helix repeat-containing protein [Massilia sp. IC2-278]|uniref:right-handed parallel beta-helix repeat-containing protein n=1 Tax=Massilia sp. IC2-278 TaxID=2887200 RepID=UPI001E64C8B5|nr:right-handed parallel beta-helix repeat-containing protein [Massilia sp. IC2-278]MCC2961290.1 right-handed parallel beta-helix repeat-containing protein [Massilia sp. IC2-278]